MAGFVLLYRLEYFRKATAPLLTYGRMSLTNYVSQSVIGSLIFFPYALGMAPYCGLSLIHIFGGGAVDFIRQHNVGEDGPFLEDEVFCSVPFLKNRGSRDVSRQ